MAIAAAPSEPAVQRRPAVPLHRGLDLHLEPHPNAPNPVSLASVRAWVRSAPRPTAIDLFCGAGGLSLGLAAAGFTLLVGADHDPRAVETHTANIGGLGYRGDLGDPDDFLDHLDAWGIREVDLLAGGVPCQPFSRAGRSKIRSLVANGRRSADDPRAQMWQSFTRVAVALSPRAILLENVPDLATWNEGAVLVGFCESLREMGYRVDVAILNAFEHGVPQHRSRLFVVGVRPGLTFSWPKPSSARPSIRDAISDLPVVPGGQREERLPYPGPKTALQRRLRQGVPAADRGWVYDHITREVRPDDAEAFLALGQGQTYKDLPSRLQRYRADIFSDKYNRLVWDGLSRSITAHLAKDGYWYIHPDQARTLSVRESARIQTFPDWFRFAGQPSLRYRQIGNAVPPVLAVAIGKQLRRSVDAPARRGRPAGTGSSVRSLLLNWHKQHARVFPWRDRSDPWHVLVAEMCLHRTRAEQVRPVFEALLELAPTPAAMLSGADKVRNALRSLGLRWRADKILEVARVLVEEHGGAVPNTESELRALPGVGDYVANAVLSFGFNRPAILLDTNTQRIVSRLRGGSTVQRWQLRLDLYKLAGPTGADAAFNYALLDLGALLCTATRPTCSECPLLRRCATANPHAATRQPRLTNSAG